MSVGAAALRANYSDSLPAVISEQTVGSRLISVRETEFGFESRSEIRHKLMNFLESLPADGVSGTLRFVLRNELFGGPDRGRRGFSKTIDWGNLSQPHQNIDIATGGWRINGFQWDSGANGAATHASVDGRED